MQNKYAHRAAGPCGPAGTVVIEARLYAIQAA